MDYVINILEARKTAMGGELKSAQATVQVRVMFGEDTSWIQEARDNVTLIESRLAELDSAITKLREGTE
jgi:hypothetical protein